MNVYVDELPKSCERCQFHDTKYGRCDISGSRVEYFGCHSLTPLSEYTKQVRKEVITKVYEVLEQAVPHDLCWSWAVIKKELDQIQGE